MHGKRKKVKTEKTNYGETNMPRMFAIMRSKFFSGDFAPLGELAAAEVG